MMMTSAAARWGFIVFVGVLSMTVAPARGALILTVDNTTIEGPTGTIVTLTGSLENTGPDLLVGPLTTLLDDDGNGVDVIFAGGFAPSDSLASGATYTGDLFDVRIFQTTPGVYSGLDADALIVTYFPERGGLGVASNAVLLTTCIPECPRVPSPPSLVLVLGAGGTLLAAVAWRRSRRT